MIYGLYLSASGVMSNSHRQDVIANNIANADTVGFKRDMALFQQRLTESQARARGQGNAPFGSGASNPLLENIGGGILASPSLVDNSQGEFEHTGSALDVAISGDGYFGVRDMKAPAGSAGDQTFLTRDGRFSVDAAGQLVLSNGVGQAVLDPQGKPIVIKPGVAVTIGKDGVVSQKGQPVGRIGVYAVDNPNAITKQGGNLLSANGQPLRAGKGELQSEFVERANVDPANELTQLMQTQRDLEANANMIRYQDQTLQRLVNEVGKIG